MEHLGNLLLEPLKTLQSPKSLKGFERIPVTGDAYISESDKLTSLVYVEQVEGNLYNVTVCLSCSDNDFSDESWDRFTNIVADDAEEAIREATNLFEKEIRSRFRERIYQDEDSDEDREIPIFTEQLLVRIAEKRGESKQGFRLLRRELNITSTELQNALKDPRYPEIVRVISKSPNASVKIRDMCKRAAKRKIEGRFDEELVINLFAKRFLLTNEIARPIALELIQELSLAKEY